ncbi:MAG: DMT family transporter [Pseudohongiellaceae bacterium]
MPNPTTSQQKALLYGLAAVACWSTVATAFKLTLAELDVFQLVFFSTLTASLTLTGTVAATSGLPSLVKDLKEHWRITLAAGLMNPMLYYVILFQAYDLLPAQVAMSINYTWAIVLSLMAIVFLGQKILAADIGAAVICYGGVFVIATQGDITSFGDVSLAGIGLALLSTVIWAGYWTLNVADKRESLNGLCLNFLLALPLSLLACLLFSDLNVTMKGVGGAIYVGLVEMAIAFLLWSRALKLTTNAARVSNLIFLAPFVSLVIINQLLGEPLFVTTFIGLVLIISGLLYQQAMHRRLRA